MRDYLKLHEIKEVLDRTHWLDDNEITLVMAYLTEEADTCLCSAHSYSECTCGAWDYEAMDDALTVREKVNPECT